MEKLTIKELAPYLPYGLKFIVEVPKLSGNPPEPECMVEKEEELNVNNIGKCLRFNIAPLLRPLYELIDFMNEYDEIFCHGVNMGKSPQHLIKLRIQILSDPKTRTHEELDWLLYNHFDVFDLIDRGLALNKNNFNSK